MRGVVSIRLQRKERFETVGCFLKTGSCGVGFSSFNRPRNESRVFNQENLSDFQMSFCVVGLLYCCRVVVMINSSMRNERKL